MPGLDMLDVAIGVIFMYLLVSLICSGAAEFLEALLRFRARDLEHGIRELLQNKEETVKAIYEHPLVKSLYAGAYGVSGPTKYAWVNWVKMAMSKRRLPSYIPARNFALALLETIGGQNSLSSPVPPPPPLPPPPKPPSTPPHTPLPRPPPP